jgi:hypothetical protein
MRVLAEIIASDVSLLITFNQAIDGFIQNNQKARQNPKALAQLDGYKRPLVGSLSANLQRFGMERVAKVESLQENHRRNEWNWRQSRHQSTDNKGTKCYRHAIMIACKESRLDDRHPKILKGVLASHCFSEQY